MPPELKPVVRQAGLVIGGLSFVILMLVAAQSKVEPIEPVEPQRWRQYDVNGVRIYEWRDEWGRVCTQAVTNQANALDCDYPQENTP